MLKKLSLIAALGAAVALPMMACADGGLPTHDQLRDKLKSVVGNANGGLEFDI